MNAVQNNLLAYAGPQPEQVHSELHYMTARQLLSIFRRHRWLIGAIVAGVTLITAVAVFTATPIFEATATVRVELVGGSGDEETANAAQNEARMRSEEHTSELQSLMRISYAVFCLKKKKKTKQSQIKETKISNIKYKRNKE